MHSKQRILRFLHRSMLSCKAVGILTKFVAYPLGYNLQAMLNSYEIERQIVDTPIFTHIKTQIVIKKNRQNFL